MTKHLEKEFDLFKESDDSDEQQSNPIEQYKEKQRDAAQLINALSNAEKINFALDIISDLEDYQEDMDEISKEAMASYVKILELGMHSPIGNASRILEVANNMLRTALDARNSKTATKLKVIDLQLRKERIDVDKGEAGPSGSGAGLGHREIVDIVKSIQDDSKNKD